MTKEEALEYRRNSPYDASGSYDWLVSDMEQDTPYTAEEQEDILEEDMQEGTKAIFEFADHDIM